MADRIMELERRDNLDGPVLEVYLLGLLDFEEVLRLQRRLVFEVSGSGGQLAALILCEHHPIITVGRLGSRSHIDCDDDELAARGLTVRWVNRGGGCRLQAPGQLAVYPIWPFQPTFPSIGDFVGRLERCVLEVLDEFAVRPVTSDGVTIRTASGPIASIGVAVSRWVTYHGVTLNVCGWKEPYRLVRADGTSSAGMTTMEAERQRPAPMAKVRECFVRKFVENFDVARYNFFSSHPSLTRSKIRRAYVSSASQ